VSPLCMEERKALRTKHITKSRGGPSSGERRSDTRDVVGSQNERSQRVQLPLVIITSPVLPGNIQRTALLRSIIR